MAATRWRIERGTERYEKYDTDIRILADGASDIPAAYEQGWDKPHTVDILMGDEDLIGALVALVNAAATSSDPQMVKLAQSILAEEWATADNTPKPPTAWFTQVRAEWPDLPPDAVNWAVWHGWDKGNGSWERVMQDAMDVAAQWKAIEEDDADLETTP